MKMRKRIRWLGIALLLSLVILGVATQRYWAASVLRPLPFSSKVVGPPKGLTTVVEAAQRSGACLITSLQPAEQEEGPLFPIEIHQPKNILLPPTSLLVLPEARICGSTGVVITEEDLVIAETTLDWVKKPAEHTIFRKRKLPKLHKTSDCVAVIASKSADCYFHWMFDILPRLEILRLSQLPYDKICVNEGEQPFQAETLKTLQIEPEKMVWGNRALHLQAKRVLLPSLPAPVGHIPRWSCAFLRDKFLPKDKEFTQERRIFISRRGAAYRKISNEEEVTALLEKNGFEVVLTEALTVAEQAALFASAKIIIAQHGASLTNLVFCQPGTEVVEFYSSNWLNDCYWRLSRNMQLRHHCLLSPLTTPEAKKNKKFDITVDCVQLQQLLDQIGIR